MNEFETELYTWLKSLGMKVYKTGLPDFFCYYIDGDKSIPVFIEAKRGKDNLSNEQREVCQSLKRCNLSVFVLREDYKKYEKSLPVVRYNTGRKSIKR